MNSDLLGVHKEHGQMPYESSSSGTFIFPLKNSLCLAYARTEQNLSPVLWSIFTLYKGRVSAWEPLAAFDVSQGREGLVVCCCWAACESEGFIPPMRLD